MDYTIIPASEIDQLKWDSCVHYASQPSFSGYTWYLQAVSKDWVGLVQGDYESVLPLFFDRDWLGRKRHRQPHHIGPNGLFSHHVISRAHLLDALRALPPRTQNLLLPWEGQIGLDHVKSATKQRFLLSLYDAYDQLTPSMYPKLVQDSSNWHWGTPTPETVTAFWLKHSKSYAGRKEDQHRYHRIIYQAMHRGQAFSSSVGRDADKPLAMAYFIASHGYLFRLISACIPSSEGENAMLELYRSQVETNAGRTLILDFNGDKLGSKLGAASMNYTLIHSV